MTFFAGEGRMKNRLADLTFIIYFYEDRQIKQLKQMYTFLKFCAKFLSNKKTVFFFCNHQNGPILNLITNFMIILRLKCCEKSNSG